MTDNNQLSLTQILPFSWDQVCLAFWRRYPNPYAKHIVAEDVIERRIVDGRLHTRRLIVKQRSPGALPRYLKSLAGKCETVVEDSIIDPAAKTIVTTTRNVGRLSRLGIFTETVHYTPSGEETNVQKIVDLRPAVPVPAWLERKANNYFISKYVKQVEETNRGFLHVLRNMFPVVAERALDNYKASQEYVRSARQSLKERFNQTRARNVLAGRLVPCMCPVCSRPVA